MYNLSARKKGSMADAKKIEISFLFLIKSDTLTQKINNV